MPGIVLSCQSHLLVPQHGGQGRRVQRKSWQLNTFQTAVGLSIERVFCRGCADGTEYREPLEMSMALLSPIHGESWPNERKKRSHVSRVDQCCPEEPIRLGVGRQLVTKPASTAAPAEMYRHALAEPELRGRSAVSWFRAPSH